MSEHERQHSRYGRNDYGERWDRDRSDRERNIIDRVVEEVRSWFNDDDRVTGRAYGRDRNRREGRDLGPNYPDYGSDLAHGYTGRDEGRDYAGRDYPDDDSDRDDRGIGGSYQGRSAGDWREASRLRSGAPRTSFVYSEFWLVPGPHAGVGPKGYRRSSERIREEICERLERHGRIDASDIEIDVDDDGEVRLSGTVDRREAKRWAEDVAESVSGVHDVQNQIRVRQGQRFGEGPAGERATGDASYQEGLTASTARTEQAAKKQTRTDH